ncbi:FkbM family methyltransferase [Solirubrobacter sp. CPCC 204708]|uniref:FkbM family methyltransferase n=1 Tax=Solirubrobacter deserti TaxID=2282478 RepID=A0ABT4RM41_9ACTN|nr:FkbM family methyltransferase [Solirubrobacter deserti]MBE2317956.1 FkbM family methyltransferase [Solirubrobacter deserti]MDA0139635.1 FkbM family methyltransferase [Solirubrobacter deserti]
MPQLVSSDTLKVLLTRYPRAYDAARRPYALSRYLLRRPHEADYAVFALFAGDERPFLDVGANAGMSALSFRIYNRRSPIVSVEPNPYHKRDLQFTGKVVRHHTYHLMAAGDRDETMTLFVPVFRGVPLTTEASLDRENVASSPSLRWRLGDRMDSSDFEIVQTTVPVRRLDELALDPGFVKLDVQGAESAALRGLEQTLRRSLPVLMIEGFSSEDGEFLEALGYEQFEYLRDAHRLRRLDDRAPQDEYPNNTVLVHPSQPGRRPDAAAPR